MFELTQKRQFSPYSFGMFPAPGRASLSAFARGRGQQAAAADAQAPLATGADVTTRSGEAGMFGMSTTTLLLIGGAGVLAFYMLRQRKR